jgi:cytochrome c biogenesis protein CcdA
VIALVGALLAGVLTVLAPCVLPLLPVIVGGSATSSRRSAVVITASLAVSVVAFTLALKASTSLIGVPPQTWQWISGSVLIALGLVSVFPRLWDQIALRLRLQPHSHTALGGARSHGGTAGDILTGAALGPVFTSCSPLYGYVIVTVLPAALGYGLTLLAAYALGLSATLLVIAWAGQSAVRRLGWAVDPSGWFRRAIGVVFIAVGVLVMTGVMRDLETWLVENAPVRPWEIDQQFVS